MLESGQEAYRDPKSVLGICAAASERRNLEAWHRLYTKNGLSPGGKQRYKRAAGDLLQLCRTFVGTESHFTVNRGFLCARVALGNNASSRLGSPGDGRASLGEEGANMEHININPCHSLARDSHVPTGRDNVGYAAGQIRNRTLAPSPSKRASILNGKRNGLQRSKIYRSHTGNIFHL